MAPELLALKIRTRYKRLSQFTALHLFVVTLRCEHNCPYCQVSRQSEDRATFDMSQEVARGALDLAFQSPSSNLKIEFQGGEPLLNFELIKAIVSEAKDRNRMARKHLAFVIAGNCSFVAIATWSGAICIVQPLRAVQRGRNPNPMLAAEVENLPIQ